MVVNNSYQDRIRLAPTSLIGPLDRNQNLSGFHPMVRMNWEIDDHIRGVLGAYLLEYPGTAGDAFWNAGRVLYGPGNGPIPGSGAKISTGGAVASEFVGDNDGTNIVFDYSLAPLVQSWGLATEKMILTFNETGWKSYEITGIVADWFSFPGDDPLLPPDYRDLIIERLNSYVGTGTGLRAGAQGLLQNRIGLIAQSGNRANGPFFDHTALLYLPSPNTMIRSKAETMFNVEPTYNQYVGSVPGYEQTIAPVAVAEHILPNAYYLQFELENTSYVLLAGGRYKSALSLDDQEIPLGPNGEDRKWFTNNIQLAPGVVWHSDDAGIATESNIGRFYEAYSQALAAASNEGKLPDLATSIQKDLMVLYRDRDTLTEDVINQSSIPFYNKITIPTHPPPPVLGTVCQLFAAGQDFIDMLQYLAVQSLAAGGTSTDFRVATKTITSAGDTPDFINSVATATYENVYNISQILLDLGLTLSCETADLIEGDLKLPDSSVVALHRRGLDNTPLTIEVNDMVYTAIDIFNTLSTAFRRDFQDILTNQPCHTETLMFVVKKYRGASGRQAGSDTPVQTFYFTNRFDGQDIIFYDSQIKAKQRYRYTFERVMLIFGNEYSYGFPNDLAPAFEYDLAAEHYRAQLNITNLPNIKTYLVPYIAGDIVTIVEDKPPVVPEISFYPFRGVNNQVKILLNASTGITNEKPIAILEEDKDFFTDEYLSQTGLPATYDNIGAIEFKSDDPVDAYTLFRLTTKPSSYRDFDRGAELSIDPEQGIPGAFTDTIRPNTKYYYCARAVDINGNISNPTHIFEIEMIDNAGQIFLRQDIVQFESSQSEYAKTGQRYIYIEPSMLQLVLDDASTAGPPSVTSLPTNSILGPTGPNTGVDKVWEKKFKIRTTSKKTGRKLDLNITFKNTGIVNPSE